MNYRSHPEREGQTFRDNESKELIYPQRIVVKFGTGNLCNSNGELDQIIFNDYARQIVELRAQGVEVIVVSSAAIQAGREYLGELGRDDSRYDKPQLSSLGQARLMNRWRFAFDPYGIGVGQILVTYANWNSEEEKASIKNCILGLLKEGDTPILNESDPVSNKEIVSMEKRISENDKLTSMVTFLVNANAVLFLTDERGVYTGDPKRDPSAKLYEEIDIQNMPLDLVASSSSESITKGSGGITQKLDAAISCARRDVLTVIASSEEDVILRFARGESVGTHLGTSNRIKEN